MDILDHLNSMIDDLYRATTGQSGGGAAPSHQSGDADLDAAWRELDAFMNSGRARAGGGNPFSGLDSDFAEFDRQFASARPAGSQAADFEALKAKARVEAERQQAERERYERAGTGYTGGYGSGSGSRSGAGSAGGSGYRQSSGQQTGGTADDRLRQQAEQLVRDYGNLEIKPGATVDEVKAAYKKMLKQYHPDRFASDPAKQHTATQITAKLNESYSRIMKHLGQR